MVLATSQSLASPYEPLTMAHCTEDAGVCKPEKGSRGSNAQGMSKRIILVAMVGTVLGIGIAVASAYVIIEKTVIASQSNMIEALGKELKRQKLYFEVDGIPGGPVRVSYS